MLARTPPLGTRLADGVAGGVAALAPSGVPSTLHALATGADVREGAAAAGSLVLGDQAREQRLLMAAVPVHVALSLAWGAVLGLVLPRRGTVAAGAVGGLAIAALDLGIVARRFPRIRALYQPPQVADHLAFGLVVGAVVSRRRARRFPTAGS